MCVCVSNPIWRWTRRLSVSHGSCLCKYVHHLSHTLLALPWFLSSLTICNMMPVWRRGVRGRVLSPACNLRPPSPPSLSLCSLEVTVIRRLIEYRDRAFAMVFSAVFSICTTLGVMIGNVLGRTYNDALKVPGSNLVWLLPLVVFAVVFSCVLLVSPLFYSSGAKRLLSKREKDQ